MKEEKKEECEKIPLEVCLLYGADECPANK